MRRGGLKVSSQLLGGGCVLVADHDFKAGQERESSARQYPDLFKPSSTLAERLESFRNAACDSRHSHIPCPSSVPFRAIYTRGTPRSQSRVRVRNHRPSSKGLGSIRGKLRTMCNASTMTQPIPSAISDTFVWMIWEARKSGQGGSL